MCVADISKKKSQNQEMTFQTNHKIMLPTAHLVESFTLHLRNYLSRLYSTYETYFFR